MGTLFESARSGASVLVSETGVERLQLVARAGTSTTLVGGSRDAGQMPSGPSPYELLSIALATCSAMTMRLYAERAKLALARVEVGVTVKRGKDGQRDRFTIVLQLAGDLDEHQRAKLVDVASHCPVGKLLGHAADVTAEVYDEGSTSADVP